MNSAIEEGLTPFLQLQHNQYKKPVGAEILMRPLLGNISEIVSIFEENNCVEEIDLAAFAAALKYKKTTNLKVACNFSGLSLSKRQVVDTLRLMRGASNITIEITESARLSEYAIKHIEELASLGMRISLDDFGSDRNGLNRFVQLPLSEIKLDRFICQRLINDRAKIAIENALDLGERYGCVVVVEGVEQEWQFNLLKKLGVKYFQGFYFHEPQELFCHQKVCEPKLECLAGGRAKGKRQKSMLL